MNLLQNIFKNQIKIEQKNFPNIKIDNIDQGNNKYKQKHLNQVNEQQKLKYIDISQKEHFITLNEQQNMIQICSDDDVIIDETFSSKKKDYKKLKLDEAYIIISKQYFKWFSQTQNKQNLNLQEIPSSVLNIVDPWTNSLRSDLNRDLYTVVTEQEYKTMVNPLKNDPVFRRKVQKHEGGLYINLRLNSFRYYILTRGRLQKIQKGIKDYNGLQPSVINHPKDNYVSMLIYQMIKKQKKLNLNFNTCDYRVWLSSTNDQNIVKNKIQEIAMNFQKGQENYVFYFQGSILKKQAKINDYRLSYQNIIIVQVVEKILNDQQIMQIQMQKNIKIHFQPTQQYFLFASNIYQCKGCGVYAYSCKRCKNCVSHFCSKACYKQDKKYHQIQKCKQYQQIGLFKPFNFDLNQESRRGIAGINSLGKTSYLSVIIQFFSHIQQFQRFLTKKLFYKNLNVIIQKQNSLLFLTYVQLWHQLWVYNKIQVSPYHLYNRLLRMNPKIQRLKQNNCRSVLQYFLLSFHKALKFNKQTAEIERFVLGQQDLSINIQNDSRIKKKFQYFRQQNSSFMSQLFFGETLITQKCNSCSFIQRKIQKYDIINLINCERRQLQVYFIHACSINSLLAIPVKAVVVKSHYSTWKNIFTQSIGINKSYFQIYLVHREYFMPFNQQTADRVYDQIGMNPPPTYSVIAYEYFNQDFNGTKYMIPILFLLSQLAVKNRFTKSDNMYWSRFPIYLSDTQINAKSIMIKIYRILYYRSFFNFYKQKISQDAFIDIMMHCKPLRFVFRVYKSKQHKYNQYKKIYQIHQHFQHSFLIQEQTNLLKWKKQIIQNKVEIGIDIELFAQKLLNYIVFVLKQQQETEQGYKKYGQNKQSFQCLLNRFKEPYSLQNWSCSKCGCRQGTGVNKIFKTSKYLLFYLSKKRKTKNGITKDPTDLIICHNIDVRSIVYGNDDNIQGVFKSQKFIWLDETMRTKYRLCGVINHRGSYENGHYSYIVRRDQMQGQFWVLFDDNRIRVIDKQQVLTAEAQILIYKK